MTKDIDPKDLQEDENDTDDVTFEEEEENVSPKDVIKKLREKLKTAQEEKQNYLNSWQRDKADFINAKKRNEEDKNTFLKFAEEGIITELIPVLNSFNMAMGNKEAWEKADKNWRVGVEYIHSQLLNTLTNHGLQRVDPLGKHFDPKEHESVALIETNKKDEDHVILEVVSSGYSLNGKILKAPQVKVGEYKG